jgi:predicted acyltransferase
MQISGLLGNKQIFLRLTAKRCNDLQRNCIIFVIFLMTNTVNLKRLHSLDAMRGFIMVLLAMESTGLYENLHHILQGGSGEAFITQFFHHPWNGLRFWDLIQPGFMFIAGTAMAFSLKKQADNGMSWKQSFRKTLKRSGWLFFWGVLNYAVRPGGLSFELWNVLTQLAFTTLLAFLIFNWKLQWQVLFSVGLLLLTEVLYRYTNIPGFDQPFTDQHNFGNYMDMVLMNKINSDGWVAINCIPTAVHTIAGALAGKFLLEKKDTIKPLIWWGFATMVAGFLLDYTQITPVIKRIATSSFTLASLGWCLAGLAFFYWWIDIRKHHKYLLLFTVMGMNAIFIYLFFEIVGARWFNGYVAAITNGLMKFTSITESVQHIISSLAIFVIEWVICYFLYKKKIFFKL